MLDLPEFSQVGWQPVRMFARGFARLIAGLIAGCVCYGWLTACAAPPTLPVPATPALTATTQPLAPLPSPSPPPVSTVLPVASPTPRLAPAAHAYLTAALDLLQAHALRRDLIDWDDLRAQVFARAGTAQSIPAVYPAVRLALYLLEDQHSFFLEPEAAAELQSFKFAAAPPPSGQILAGKLAYLEIQEFASGSSQENQAYVDAVQGLLLELDSQSPCGWIVDLRENSGGDMWQMLAGLSGLLGENSVGAFVQPDGSLVPWIIRAGQAYEGETLRGAPSQSGGSLLNGDAPLAVLLGPGTASSAEAVAIAFHGREHTLFFGQPSMGLTTANENFTLADGALLFVTTARFADRTGQVFSGSLRPDVTVDSTETPAPAVALEWLLNQANCR